MATKDYKDYPEQFKSAWLNENNPKGIIIDFPEFKEQVFPDGTENPKNLGWWEYNKKSKHYIKTEDTSVYANKWYFTNGELTYYDNDVEDDSFKLSRELQSGSTIDFMGCIASTLEFKVKNDFRFLNDQKLTATLTVDEQSTSTTYTIKVFTGWVDEVKRDKSTDLSRTLTCHDFMHRLLDNYDVTDWYVWQYGDSEEENQLKRNVYTLRNTFWDYICNSGTVYDPSGQAIKKKGEGWTQVTGASLVNDSIKIPKTLNVTPVDFDEYIASSRIGGPFRRYPKTPSATGTQYDVYTIPAGWNIKDLVARKDVIELGLVGTLFSYNSVTDTNYKQYMDACDTAGTGLRATIKIPREEQEKVRETQITAATVLQAICQFNGVFGQVNGDGLFEYIKLDTSNPTEPLEQYQIDIKFSDIEMPAITGVVIFDKTSEEYSEDSIHTEYGDVKNGKKGSALAYYPNDRTQIEGDNAHVFTMDDNFLMNSFEQKDAMAIAENLYNQIKNISIRNVELDIKAMPWLKCGQAISYKARSDVNNMDTTYISVIMNYSISGTGLVKGNIKCNAEDLSSEIVNLNEVISSELFYRKIGDSKNYSEISQTAQRIELKVADEVEKIYSKITVEVDRIDLEINGPNGVLSKIQLNTEGIQLLGQTVEIQATKIQANATAIEVNAHDIQVNAGDIRTMAGTVTYLTEHGVTYEALLDGSKTIIDGGTIQTGTIQAGAVTTGYVNGRRVEWQRLIYASPSSTQYIYQSSVSRDIMITDQSVPPATGYVLKGSFNSINAKYMFTLAQDNA